MTSAVTRTRTRPVRVPFSLFGLSISLAVKEIFTRVTGRDTISPRQIDITVSHPHMGPTISDLAGVMAPISGLWLESSLPPFVSRRLH